MTHLHWPGGRVAQGADGVAFDLLGQLPQRVDLVGMGVSFHESVHHFQQPRRPFPVPALYRERDGEGEEGGGDGK